MAKKKSKMGPSPIKPADWAKAILRINQGKATPGEVAEKLGVTTNAVYLQRKNHKAKSAPSKPGPKDLTQGAPTPRDKKRKFNPGKLDKHWEDIVAGLNVGDSVNSMAKKYGVPQSSIHSRLRAAENKSSGNRPAMRRKKAPVVNELIVPEPEEKISATIIKINGTPDEVQNFLRNL